ncbi:unnamed protein product [Candida verbasci]|uniref:I-AAA protease complex subunit Mgr1 n=1 Tax=Candida verbasci TaxID=1227364 RepID=A0A9W4X8Y9_9ASCO|nr:unnamed protein product [Candida verbasci]
MGVYIPPPNDDDDSNKKDKSKQQKSTNITPTDDDKGYKVEISLKIPKNPSVGLFWGPLTPASDNKPAMYTMIGLQFLIGVKFFSYARNNLRLNFINGRIFRKSIWKGISQIIIGSGLVFGSGLELTRVLLPYDPWREEAKYYRKIAFKNGVQPSFWFGGLQFYTPMSTKTWIEKTNTWLKNMEKRGNPSKNSELLLKLNSKGKYNEIYQKLYDTNNTRFQHLLTNELVNVNENNKGIRLDEILEGNSELVNPDYSKPNIQLGNHTMENDDEFEMVWVNFDPWDEIKLETDYDIRLIPRCNASEEENENEKKLETIEIKDGI